MDNESIDDLSRLSFAGEGGFECFELMHENGEELAHLHHTCATDTSHRTEHPVLSVSSDCPLR